MSDIGKRINEVMAAGIAPLLKRKQFRKQGRTFYRKHENRVELVNVQASKWNEGETGQFTLNLGVYFPSVAEITEAIPFRGLPKEYQCTVRKRIGQLMPGNTDHWWKIDPSVNSEFVTSDVAATLEKYGIPWLNQMADLNAVKQTTLPFVSAGIALLLGDKQQAKDYLKRALEQQPLAAEMILVWGKKHQLIEA